MLLSTKLAAAGLFCCIALIIHDVHAQAKPTELAALPTPRVHLQDVWVEKLNGTKPGTSPADTHPVKFTGLGWKVGEADACDGRAYYPRRDLLLSSSATSMITFSAPMATTTTTLMKTTYSDFVFTWDGGSVRLNMKTGAVDVKGAPDEAAREFWKALARVYPDARKNIIEGKP